MNYMRISFCAAALVVSAAGVFAVERERIARNESYETIGDLRCEYLENPIGIDIPNPRLAWRLPLGVKEQKGYSIVVGTDSADVAKGRGDAWESGFVASCEVLAEYAGKELESDTRYWWKVIAESGDSKSFESPVTYFETALMSVRDWRGWWITDTRDKDLRPAASFRKEFDLKGDIVSAKAYVAAGGLFELYLNGEKAGDDCLEPAFTRYDKTMLYVTKDITDLLHEGRNAVGVLMGNGWYNHQAMAVWDYETVPWRARPCFCADIRVRYADGTEQVVFSDKTWKTHLSSVIYDNIYTAAHIDGRLDINGWAEPGFDDKGWNGVRLTSAPAGRIASQTMRPVRDVDTLKAVSVTKLSDKEYVFDFGQNISGVTELNINGEAGTTLRLKHGEYLRGGRVTTENIDYFYRGDVEKEPFAVDIFTLGGNGREVFRQKFGYKGFRYVEVSADRAVSLDESSLTAYFVHSDIPQTGYIHSSNEVINKLWKASCYSYLSNLVGYPTDCPQREKNGWTGDTNAAMDIGLYNYDPITVYEKWMGDHKDAQLPNGVYPNIIPTSGWGYDWGNGTDWTSTNITIPWRLWLFYGDSRPLFSMYENMKAYMDYIERTYPGGLTDWGLGDWIPVKSSSTLELTSSIYYHEDARIMARVAEITGHTEDAAHYEALAKLIRDRINEKYLDKERGVYATGTQTEQAMPLFWNVVPDEYRRKVAANLASMVKENGLDVGLLGSKAILGALSDNGYLELAFSLATSTEYPSWGHWLANGATTFYENWNLDNIRDLSFNHMMYGEINAWFYKALAGFLPRESEPGFREFDLRPGFPQGLSSFEASHVTPNGEIHSSWKRKGSRITYTVTVPSNSVAHLELPGVSETLACGTHEFTFKAPRVK